MPRSALVVLVPEAEALVEALRLRYDPMAVLGVPAHVTVLFPFVSPVDDVAAARVGATCRQHAPFTVEFTAVDRFPGSVIWLRPEPSAPFAALTAAMVAEFPGFPPYSGRIAEPVPHLTVADDVDDATAETLRVELGRGLPIRSQVNELVLLLEDETSRWHGDRAWPMGGAIAG
jgi:2'-5' RNA ligase